MRLVIGSRKSDLARLQSYRVAEALQIIQPNLKIEFFFKASMGDQNLDQPLWKLPQKGVFTEDFVKDLKSGTVDLVVHSWKDLPVENRHGTEIVATLQRADLRDLLLLKKSSLGKPNLFILSSSPRRAYNLRNFFSWAMPFKVDAVHFESVRGNIPTRFRKYFDNQQADGLIVAKAALDRLLSAHESEFSSMQADLRFILENSEYMVLPLSESPAAAAQGALAIEIPNDRADLKSLLERVNQQSEFENVLKERDILKSFGGGCHQKIGISLLDFQHFSLKSLKGLTDTGEVLEEFSLESKHKWPKFELSQKSPTPWSSTELKVVRQPLPNNSAKILTQLVDKIANSNDQLFLAYASRAETMNVFESLKNMNKLKVLVAGIESWKKLAAKGWWVSGTSESLGDSFLPSIQWLSKFASAYRLTHQKGLELRQTILTESMHLDCSISEITSKTMPDFPAFETISTYLAETEPAQQGTQALKFSSKTHFFWKSGNQFLDVLKEWPELLNQFHGCGPGHTYETLLSAGVNKNHIEIFLNEKSFFSRFAN